MTMYRKHLPQLNGAPFLTDGGLETDMIFHQGIDLPLFAAVDALRHAAGTRALEAYYRRYLDIADEHGLGFVLESPTWRASVGWGEQLGYASGAMDGLNEQAIELLARLRDERSTPLARVVSGQIGPRGDGYDPGAMMSIEEAAEYHAQQIAVFASTDADQVPARDSKPESFSCAQTKSAAMTRSATKNGFHMKGMPADIQCQPATPQ